MPFVTALEVTGALGNLQTAFDFVKTVFGGMVSTITAEPILLVPVAIFVAGGGIGLAMRMIRG